MDENNQSPRRGMEERGAAHVFKALGHSLDGFRVLMREEAARLETAGFAVALLAFAVSGVSAPAYVVLVGLFIWLLMVEALNTAIELIVDRTSPEITAFGKETKDLGSFAVLCSLLIFGGYATLIVAVAWL